MKIIFIFGGLPHYYNAILNKLNNITNLEIIVIVPEKKGKTLGAGVFETNKNINFKVYRLREYTTIYKKPFFKGLTRIILKEKPHAIVLGWPYILGIVFYSYLILLLKVLNIKLIHKEIPYQVPLAKEAISYYCKGEGIIQEDLSTKHIDRNTWKFKLKIHFLTFLRKVYYRLASAHVNYLEEAYEILESYGVSKEKIFITYNSPDTDNLLRIYQSVKNKENAILPPNPHRIIHVGRLIKWKKVHLLIDVFKEIQFKYPEAELIVIGTGTEEDHLKKQAISLNLQNSVKFIGGVYDTTVLGEYLHASTIYVLAGVGGLSINEAMAFGKPVICSECDGTEKKLVRDEYNGKFFQNDNAKDLYEKIDYLFSRPELLKTMEENSLNIIKNEINIHTVIKGYVKAFNFVSNNKFKLNYVE